MRITIYTKPNCGPCAATKRALTKSGVPFVQENLDEHDKILEQAIRAGYLQAPIVTVQEHVHSPITQLWGGFDIKRLHDLSEEYFGLGSTK